MSTTATDTAVRDDPSLADYRALAAFRYHLRGFLASSEQRARQAGLEPQQQQLLLVIKGLPERHAPTIGVLADRLQIRHHTVVELLDRLVAKGLVVRTRATADRRQVRITLTRTGEERLALLTRDTLQALAETGRPLQQALRDVIAHAARSSA